MKGSGPPWAAGYFLKATSRIAPPKSVKLTSTKLFPSFVTAAPAWSAWAVANVGSSEPAGAAAVAGADVAAAAVAGVPAGALASEAICLLTSCLMSAGEGGCCECFCV